MGGGRGQSHRWRGSKGQGPRGDRGCWGVTGTRKGSDPARAEGAGQT